MASLVLGIVGILFGIIPFTFFLAWACGVIALVLGIVGRGRANRNPAMTGKGIGLAGAIMGGAALALGVVGIVILVVAFDKATGVADTDDYDLTEESCRVNVFGTAEATGRITNTSGAEKRFIVDVEFRDASDGSRIEQRSDFVNDLSPGQSSRWRIVADVDTTDVECEVLEVENFFN